MIDKELNNQNLADMLRVINILWQILEAKQLTEAEEVRIKYGTKVLYNVIEKVSKDK